jgi:hypothetical protein
MEGTLWRTRGALLSSRQSAPIRQLRRVYRGSPVGETWAPEGALRNTTFWASDNPEVAGYYAGDRGVGPNVMPADVSFKNPLVVDAGGREWTGIPWGSGTKATDTLANLARTFGHDGLVVRNVRDNFEGGPPATTYAALRPGTVFSPLTGEQLYANGSGLPGLLGVPSNAQQGDGRPDSLQGNTMAGGVPSSRSATMAPPVIPRW